MECWAKALGDCDGPMTREHIITRALLPKTFKVQGYTWCAEEPRPIGKDSFTSKHLCSAHNNRLSAADAEAVRLRNYLLDFVFVNPRAKQKKQVDPFTTLSGTLIARWLCKTHCNMKAASRLATNPDFVRYAFGQRPTRRLRFYSIVDVGTVYWPRTHPPNIREFFSQDGKLMVVTNFYGWIWIVTNFDFSPDAQSVLQEVNIHIDKKSLMDRITAISVQKTKPRYNAPLRGALKLDWSREYEGLA